MIVAGDGSQAQSAEEKSYQDLQRQSMNARFLNAPRCRWSDRTLRLRHRW